MDLVLTTNHNRFSWSSSDKSHGCTIESVWASSTLQCDKKTYSTCHRLNAFSFEANETFSIYTSEEVGTCKRVCMLIQVPSYKTLCDDAETRTEVVGDAKSTIEGICDDEQNNVAIHAC